MANIVEILLKITKQGKGDEETRSSVQKLTDEIKKFAGIAGAIYIAKKAFDVLKDSVEQSVAYNKQIREMSQATGMQAEELSRIVQVADDFGISMGSVETALKVATKNGFLPTIDNLALLADRYVRTSDKTQFAAEAQKIFGRNWSELVPILAKGGKALKEQAASISDGLIATKESIRIGREYEVNMDRIGDSVMAVKYKLADQLLPSIVKVTGGLAGLAEANLNVSDSQDRLIKLHEAGLITDKQLAETRRDLREGTTSVALVNRNYAEEIKKLSEIEEHNAAVEFTDLERRKAAIQLYGEQTEATEDTTQAIGFYKDELYNTSLALEDANYAQQDLIQYGIDAYHSALDQLVDEAIRGYTDSLAESMVMQASFKLAMGEITQAEFDQIAAQKPAIENLERMNKLLNDKNITWDYYFQVIKDGKVTNEELISALIATGLSAEEARKLVEGLKDEIERIPTYREFNLHMKVTGESLPGGTLFNPYTGNYEFQHGVDMIVPQGFPNDTLPVRVSSGERLIVIPRNQVENTGGPGIGKTEFNIYANYAYQPEEDVTRTIRSLAILYGLGR